MRKSYKKRLADHVERFPELEIILTINYSPNSMNLWNRIKTHIRRRVDISGCRFNLKGRYSEDDLAKDIIKIHDERYNYDSD